MSIPDNKQTFTFEFSFTNIAWILIVATVVIFVYGVIFHGLPYEEAKQIQNNEIKNTMSCGELKQMILDKTYISRLNYNEVNHQFEWRCLR